ncbi:hypothetical protein Q4508_17745 [Amphritea sp. 2_MG-2023]|nr:MULTISPECIES: hypothetical protein [Amphritea]MDO6420401.1 hypothetical protein [Amphritea sp. 2_MG-2023]
MIELYTAAQNGYEINMTLEEMEPYLISALDLANDEQKSIL